MTVELQQASNSSASTASLVITMAVTPTAGNTLVLASGDNNGGVQGVSGGGVTWAKVSSPGTNNSIDIWSGVVTGTPGVTVTITYNAGSRCAAKILEWVGVWNPDVTNNASGLSTTVSSGSLTPSAPNAGVVAVGVIFKDTTGTIGGPFADEGKVTSASFTVGVGRCDDAPGVAVQATWTAATAGAWDGAIASFLQASGVTATIGSTFGWSTSLTGEETNTLAVSFGWSTALAASVTQPVAARPFAAPVTTATYTVSGSIDATGTTDVTAALNNWVSSVPNGSIIVFPPGSTYLLSQGIQISQRNNLVLQGTGCTLKMAPGAGQTQLQSNIIIGHAYGGGWTLGCHDILIDGFTLIGNIPITRGTFLAAYEQQANLEFGDGTRIEAKNCTGQQSGGDFVFFEDVSNAWVHDCNVIDAGRNGFSTIDRCDNVLVENCFFGKIGYCTFDLEPNTATYNRFITARNNTWGTWGNAFLAIDGSSTGAEFSDVTITGNTGVGPNLLTAVVGPGRKQRINFSNNTSSAAGTGATTFTHVDGLTFKFNYQHGVHTTGTFIDCTAIDTAEAVSATMGSTFGWSTGLFASQNAAVLAVISAPGATFGWRPSIVAAVVGATGTGIGETVITYTPAPTSVTFGRGHAYNRWISTDAGQVYAADAGVVIVGEQYIPTYIARGDAVSIATANAHVLQLMASSTLNVRIYRICVLQYANATSAGVGQLEIWRLSTAGTGGSAVTPVRDDNGDASAGATAMTLPSSKGTESTRLWAPTVPWRSSGSGTGGDETLWEWVPAAGTKPLIIPAGTANGIAVKNITATAAATVEVWVEFTETLWL